MGDEVAVREKEGDGCYRYLLSHVIEVLEEDGVVLWHHGTFQRDGRNAFLGREFLMLEPTEAVVEAARSRALYVPRSEHRHDAHYTQMARP